MKDRVQREKNFYSSNPHHSYKNLLSHGSFFYYRHRFGLIREKLLPYKNQRFLELGSNSWIWWAQRLPIINPQLTCINISESELDIGIRASKFTRVKPKFKIMDAHDLQFPNNFFDVVCGNGVLHHLDMDIALEEINRVLRPGGVIWFFEPLDNNIVGKVVRKLTPNSRTPDETPLRLHHLRKISSIFDCTYHWEELFSLPIGIFSKLFFKTPDNKFNRLGYTLDSSLLKYFPALGPYYRYVVIFGLKSKST